MKTDQIDTSIAARQKLTHTPLCLRPVGTYRYCHEGLDLRLDRKLYRGCECMLWLHCGCHMQAATMWLTPPAYSMSCRRRWGGVAANRASFSHLQAASALESKVMPCCTACLHAASAWPVHLTHNKLCCPADDMLHLGVQTEFYISWTQLGGHHSMETCFM